MAGLLDFMHDAAAFHIGTDLIDRLQLVQKIIAAKDDAINQAVNEIRRLQARVRELEQQANATTHPNAYPPPHPHSESKAG